MVGGGVATLAAGQVSDQAQAPILEALLSCRAQKLAPFYAPGHKGGYGVDAELRVRLGAAAFELDLPELPEFDSLHDPQGPIRAAQALAAELYGAAQTWFLVNGSTGGIQAMIQAVCRPGDRLIVPRDAHRSVVAGLILADVLPVYLEPERLAAQGFALGVSPLAVARALRDWPQARGVLLVRPSYYGTCLDLAAIADIVHAHGLPLLVDEAHGAHLGFHPDLPGSALAAGADLVVQSTHKTLGAFSQASMLHLGRGARLEPERLSQALRLLQTTSPNSLLLASLDGARRQLALGGEASLQRTLELAAQVRTWPLGGLSLLGPEHLPPGYTLDRTRLCVLLAGVGLNGFEADDWLRQQFGVTAELPTWGQLVFILSAGNTQQHLDRLRAGLTALGELKAANPQQGTGSPAEPAQVSAPVLRLSPRQAYFAPTRTVPLEKAVGQVSAELVCPYPPGIAVVMPGEEVTAEVLACLQALQTNGSLISGAADPLLRTLRVVQA